MSKTIELCKVRQGEFFTIDGVEFVKLDEKMGGAFAVTTDTLPDTGPFEHEDAERNDHNNFVGSRLMPTSWNGPTTTRLSRTPYWSGLLISLPWTA